MLLRNGRALPLDILLLLVLVPAHIELKAVSFLMVISLFLYLFLEVWHPLTSHSNLPTDIGKTRIFFLGRFFLLLVMVTGATVVPTVTNIYSRLSTEPDSPEYLQTYTNLHDGALQVELALDFLGNGQNPYVESYDDTPLEFYTFSGIELPDNPVLEHFVYLPGLLVLSYPIHQIFQRLDFLYDQRWISLLAYVVFVLLLPQLAKAPTLKLALIAGVALNPLLTGPVIIGMNDVITLLPLVAALFLFSQKRFLVSAILFGLACTIKQSAWFFAPFYALLLYAALPQVSGLPRKPLPRLAPKVIPHLRDFARKVNRTIDDDFLQNWTARAWQTIKYLTVAAGTAVLILAPFALWNLPDFITDVFSYPGGGAAVNYPIRGYTVGVLLVGGGMIQSPLDYFPFWSLQLVVGVPLLIRLLLYQARQNSLGGLFIAAGLLIFGVGVVSRFFQSNYVGFVATTISLGFLLNLESNNGAREFNIASPTESIL